MSVNELPHSQIDALKEDVDVLRRRLDEQGVLLRRTHTAVTSLAESLGKVVSGQRRRERWINLNSFVAYTLFTVLLGGAFFMLYHDRADDLLAARETAAQERDSARRQAKALRQDIAARQAAEEKAHEYYALLRGDHRAEAVDRYAEVEHLVLTPTEKALFADEVDKARAEIVDAGYLNGLDAYRAGQLDKALTELRTALAYEDKGPRAAQMRYYLGLSFYKKADYGSAARELAQAVAGRVDQAGVVDARFYLASALEKSEQPEKARSEFEAFASAHPQHPWAVTARRRSALLARRGIRTN